MKLRTPTAVLATAVSVAALAGAGFLATVPAGAAASTAGAAPVATPACPTTGIPAGGFADVAAAAPFAHAIDCLKWWEITAGSDATHYAPAQPVTRGEMAMFVARLVQRTGSWLHPFTAAANLHDVRGTVFAAAIDELADPEVGIVGGFADGTFRPGQLVTRGQMAKFLVQAVEYTDGAALPTGGTPFRDVARSVFAGDIAKGYAAGLFAGYGDGTFRPDDPVTRAEMAAFMTRVLDREVTAGRTTVPTDELTLTGTGDTVSNPAPVARLRGGTYHVSWTYADACTYTGRLSPLQLSDVLDSQGDLLNRDVVLGDAASGPASGSTTVRLAADAVDLVVDATTGGAPAPTGCGWSVAVTPAP